MARSSHHIVAIEGIEGAGKTTLASALQQELREEYIMVSMDVEAPATDSAEDAAEALLVARFKQHMRALRTAAHRSGVILDGCLAGELVRVEAALRAGRLTEPRATQIYSLGRRLLQRLPAPHALVLLDVPAEMRLTRTPAPRRPLEELRGVEVGLRQLAGDQRAAGCRVLTRDWRAFGSVRAIRDFVFCLPPVVKSYSEVAPPSIAASDKILADLTNRVSKPPPLALQPSPVSPVSILAPELA
mmetsp:Transcript_5940/g.18986  ORF Transcript_5940/g.18986 Transcript_5940/m.18986 type:complete len:244 (-) Transcript_5940:994-1725(-)